MKFFKIHKPLKYRYRPIYYDPKKEAQKEREKKAALEAESGKTDGTYEPKILKRGAFREIHDKSRHSIQRQKRQSNIRLIIIILLLFFIAYLLIR